MEIRRPDSSALLKEHQNMQYNCIQYDNTPEEIHEFILSMVADISLEKNHDRYSFRLTNTILFVEGFHDYIACPICNCKETIDIDTSYGGYIDEISCLTIIQECGSIWQIAFRKADKDVEAICTIICSCADVTQIYFIEAVGQDKIKIGRSQDPLRRLAELATGSSVKLKLLACFDTEVYAEAALHDFWKFIACDGEWFYATKELRRYIGYIASLDDSNEINAPSEESHRALDPQHG